jgi:hypothetical protein
VSEKVTEADRLVSVTMTAGAARELWKALVWASGRAEDEGRGEHAEWLTWALHRVSTAPAVSAGCDGKERK